MLSRLGVLATKSFSMLLGDRQLLVRGLQKSNKVCSYRKHGVPVPVQTLYLRSRKYPGGARFSCTDSFRTPRSAGKFSCKSGMESLFVKQKQGTTTSA